MQQQTVGMTSLDDRDREVLEAMADGRANPLLIRERTDLGKGDVNTVLNRLGRVGYVKQVTRGLYELTVDGEHELEEGSDA